jgi:SEC-C motif
MRLSEDIIKRGIGHPESDVRQAAVHYFSRSYSQDQTIMPLVIQAIQQYGWNDAFTEYKFMDDLRQSESTVRWMMDELKRLGPPTSMEDVTFPLALSSALAHADSEVLKPHVEEIMALAEMDDTSLIQIENRMKSFDMAPDLAWKKIEAIIETADENEELSRGDWHQICCLTKVMSRSPNDCADKVIDVLTESDPDDDFWLQNIVVNLAGESRCAEAIYVLLSRANEYHDDWEDDEVEHALVKIGGHQVVNGIASFWAEANDVAKSVLSNVLRRIRSDQCVQTCVQMFKQENDIYEKAALLKALLESFADEGIDLARAYLQITEKAPFVLPIRGALLTASKLMDRPFPEFEAWKEDAKSDKAFVRQWDIDHPDLDDDEWDDEDDDFDYEDSESEDWPLPDFDPALDLPLNPFVRDDEHVGRNDPCPCGSGKKFKKCCLGKDDDLSFSGPIPARISEQFSMPTKKPRLPLGTVTLYGPDDKTTTKIVAGVFKTAGSDPILQRWVGTDILNNAKAKQELEEFFKKNGVKSRVQSEGNIGCPHEEGPDFPVGGDCPFCSYWKGKQGSSHD